MKPVQSKLNFLPVLILVACCVPILVAKADAPVAGEPCPEFVLKEIAHHKTRQASLQDFKGQWLVLDFWSTGCTACVQSFPKVNRLQQHFKDQIQFVLVGRTDEGRNRNIRALYERFREKQNLQLTVAYDGELFEQWDIWGVPHVVIIDPQGIVYARTVGGQLSEEWLQALLNGERPDFLPAGPSGPVSSIPYEHGKLLLADGNGGTEADLLFGSLLTTYRGGGQFVYGSLEKGLKIGGTRFQVTCLILDWLYNYAYWGANDWSFGEPLYGRVARKPILEVNDPTPFKFNFTRLENLYSYSATLSPERATVAQLQRTLRRDLEGYFGHVVRLEKRQMPYWRLTATPAARRALKTRGGDAEQSEYSSAGVTLVNQPVSKLLALIWSYHQGEPPFIDETGLEGHIDITVDTILTDLNEIREALRASGLELTRSTREMTVTVISDKPEQSARTAAGGKR